MVRVGRARTFGSGGSFFQATVGLRAALNFRRALRQGRFDLLNIHGPADFGLPFWALSMFSGPKVLTLHSRFPDARWRHRIAPDYRWVFRRAAGVIAVSEATAQSMGRYADFESDHHPERDRQPGTGRSRPSGRYLRPGTRNLVFLGRLEQRNGPDVAIDAFARIAPALPNVRLLMAGTARCGRSWRRGFRRSCAGASSSWARSTIEWPELLASSSVFLLPARAVGFSIMVLEAFAAGLPVVALPALGTDRAGDHWSNVILAKDSSTEAFAAAVIEAGQRNQSDRIARGRAIADAFDWTRIGSRILDVFQRAAGAPPQVVGQRSKAAA